MNFDKAIEYIQYGIKNYSGEIDTNSFLTHSLMVSSCSAALAAVCGLDVAKASIMGLCHDIGKIISDEKKTNTFHGLTGYAFFKEKGEMEVAQTCLTHTFCSQKFENEEFSGYGVSNIVKAKKILNKIEYTDYDKIVQLSDLLSFLNRFSNLKERLFFIQHKYNLKNRVIRKKYKNAIIIKRYLEKKYHCDIYGLFKISKISMLF